MPTIKSIGANPGDSLNDCIETYLTLQPTHVTSETTVINFNDIDYPVGYFDKDNIELFKLGFTTISNLHSLISHGYSVDSKEYKGQSSYFANEIINGFQDKPIAAEHILGAFDSAMIVSSRPAPNKPGVPMFSEFDKKILEERLNQKKAEIGKSY